MRFLHILSPICLVVIWSCGGTQPNATSYTYEFSHGQQGWLAGESEYPAADANEVNFSASMQPSPIAPNQTAFHLYGVNVSDDLFLYATKQLTGLLAKTSYLVSVTTTLTAHTGEVGGSSQIIKLLPRGMLGGGTGQVNVRWGKAIRAVKIGPPASGCKMVTNRQCLTGVGIVREAMFHQLTLGAHFSASITPMTQRCIDILTWFCAGAQNPGIHLDSDVKQKILPRAVISHGYRISQTVCEPVAE